MSSSIAFTTTLTPLTSQMWLAYAIAPAAAPITFVIMVVIAGFAGMIVNPAGISLLPLEFVLGLLASYAVAGAVGMPIAFLLRRARRLNGLTIHVAALIWAFVLAIVVTAYFFIRSDGNVPAMMIAVFLYDVVPILSSASVFWTIVGYDEFTKRRYN